MGWIGALEPVTPGALARETGIPATTMRDYIRHVVASGYVRRARNPDDGRSYLLELTGAGRKLMDQGRPALVEAFAKLEPQLIRPADECAQLAVELRSALRRASAA